MWAHTCVTHKDVLFEVFSLGCCFKVCRTLRFFFLFFSNVCRSSNCCYFGKLKLLLLWQTFLKCLSLSKCFYFELRLKLVNSFVWFFWQQCQFIMYPFQKTDLAKSKTKETKFFTGYFSTMLPQTVSASQQ